MFASDVRSVSFAPRGAAMCDQSPSRRAGAATHKSHSRRRRDARVSFARAPRRTSLIRAAKPTRSGVSMGCQWRAAMCDQSPSRRAGAANIKLVRSKESPFVQPVQLASDLTTAGRLTHHMSEFRGSPFLHSSFSPNFCWRRVTSPPPIRGDQYPANTIMGGDGVLVP